MNGPEVSSQATATPYDSYRRRDENDSRTTIYHSRSSPHHFSNNNHPKNHSLEQNQGTRNRQRRKCVGKTFSELVTEIFFIINEILVSNFVTYRPCAISSWWIYYLNFVCDNVNGIWSEDVFSFLFMSIYFVVKCVGYVDHRDRCDWGDTMYVICTDLGCYVEIQPCLLLSIELPICRYDVTMTSHLFTK